MSSLQHLKNAAKQISKRLGQTPDQCEVVDCARTNPELVTLAPLDPTDHHETVVYLCPSHVEWAEERNDLAETVTDELRQERKRIGQEHYDAVRDLAEPDDGQLPHDIAMGRAESVDEAHELSGEDVEISEDGVSINLGGDAE